MEHSPLVQRVSMIWYSSFDNFRSAIRALLHLFGEILHVFVLGQDSFVTKICAATGEECDEIMGPGNAALRAPNWLRRSEVPCGGKFKETQVQVHNRRAIPKQIDL